MDQEREFRDARDAAELALGTALASVGDARGHLRRLAGLVRERADVDGLRGALELVGYALEGLALAIGHIASDGQRHSTEDEPPSG